MNELHAGLFVIQGVETCGQGKGYCLLSHACTVDADFENDIDGGHCQGLKHAFNPKADFLCCAFKPPLTTQYTTNVDSANLDNNCNSTSQVYIQYPYCISIYPLVISRVGMIASA